MSGKAIEAAARLANRRNLGWWFLPRTRAELWRLETQKAIAETASIYAAMLSARPQPKD